MTDHAITTWNPDTLEFDAFLGDDHELETAPTFVIQSTRTGERWLIRKTPHERWDIHRMYPEGNHFKADVPETYYVERDDEDGRSFVGRERTESTNPSRSEPIVRERLLREAVVRTAFWPI
ncbi:hypothetical protein [Rathayibacter sp. AY1A3]|uniref:hypothetical protein n=1 Tax=Rathayibacter sp. AY1A3 TaxID=2080521 RepID=UPI000CE8B58D|nr:hypothetical protein [Rathayibacter sp. AY1A3]PPF39166.1 hypothetical protein C5C10_03200 [Rathayibacter sp. AY1A3]